MAVDIPLAEFLARIGHDGRQLIYAPCDVPEPACRRGHHPQECIRVCLTLGYCVTPVEYRPVHMGVIGAAPYHVVYPGGDTENWMNFHNHILRSRGVLTGWSGRWSHAMAYDHGQVFDPDNDTFEFSQEKAERRGFIANCCWRVDRMERNL